MEFWASSGGGQEMNGVDEEDSRTVDDFHVYKDSLDAWGNKSFFLFLRQTFRSTTSIPF